MHQGLKVLFLDINLFADRFPLNGSGKVQPRQYPCFDLLPSNLSHEYAGTRYLNRPPSVVQGLSAQHDAIPVDTRNEDVHHGLVPVHDLLDALGFQSFAHTSRIGVLTYSNPRSGETEPLWEQRIAERLQQELILAEGLGE